MSWERRNGRRYYYRRRKVDGHVVSKYFGTGSLADAIASLDTLEGRQRSKETATRRQEMEEQDGIDRQIDEVIAQIRNVVDAHLLANGYHQHRRQWRKRRT